MKVLLKNALPITRWLRFALNFISVACLGFCLWYMLGGRLEQQALKIRFDGSRQQHASRDTADEPRPSEGEMCARLGIPRIGLDVVVLDGVAESSLRRGAGHIPGTAAPGVAGNMGIAAHRDTFFRPLRDIRKGDLIQLSTLYGQDSYRVVWTAVVKPTFVQALSPTAKRSLTLITCFPFDYVGNAPKRFIVRAERISGRLDDMTANQPARFQPAKNSASRVR